MTATPAVLPNTAGAPTPAVLLPYQQRWVADKSPFKVAEKSRRTGLTWAEAADDVLTAASARAAGGQNVYYIAYNQDMTIEYIQACSMWARSFNRAAEEIEEGFWDESEEDKHIKTFTIRFPGSGFRIVALSSRPSNLRGRQGIIVIDEAAFHEKLGELLKAAMAMLIWGGKVRVISTHDGDVNPFNELITDIRAGKRRGTVHHIPFRQAVDEGLYRRVCMRLGKPWTQPEQDAWVQSVYAFYGDGAAEELDCVPSNGGGAWLSRALIEARMVEAPVLRWECKKGFETLPEHIRRAECQDWIDAHLAPALLLLDPLLPSGFGGDFGRSGDLSVFAPWQVTKALHRLFPFLIELRNVPFRQQEQILFYMGDRLPRFRKAAMDARGNGQYLAEVAMQRWGALRVEMVMLSETWYREHTAPFKAAFEDATISVPRDAEVLADLRAFEVVRGVPRIPDRRTTDEDGKKRHGDAGVALLLAYDASCQDGAPIEFDSLGETRLGANLADYF
jgi:phage FluMu gp28-like protein